MFQLYDWPKANITLQSNQNHDDWMFFLARVLFLEICHVPKIKPFSWPLLLRKEDALKGLVDEARSTHCPWWLLPAIVCPKQFQNNGSLHGPKAFGSLSSWAKVKDTPSITPAFLGFRTKSKHMLQQKFAWAAVHLWTARPNIGFVGKKSRGKVKYQEFRMFILVISFFQI